MRLPIPSSLPLIICILVVTHHVKADDAIKIKYQRWNGTDCNSAAAEIDYLEDAACIIENSTLSHRIACFHHTWNLYDRYFIDDTCTNMNATVHQNRIINHTTCDIQEGYGQMWTCVNATTLEPMIPEPTSAPTSNATAAPTSNPTINPIDDTVKIKYQRWTGTNCNTNATEILYLQDAQCMVDNSTLSHRVACFHHTWDLYYRYFVDDTCTTTNTTQYRHRIINATTCDIQEGFAQMWTCVNATTLEPMKPPTSNPTSNPTTSAPTTNPTPTPTPIPGRNLASTTASLHPIILMIVVLSLAFLNL